MQTIHPSPLLRWSLGIDALASLATGAVMSAGHAPASALTGLPEPLLLGAGAFVLVYGAAVGVLARRASMQRALVQAVVAGNALWALACVLLAVGGWLQPTALGIAFLLVQAVVVGGLAELQWFGLRRSGVAGAPARSDATHPGVA